jgi:tripartite-type tricarboxylate transporter receptor subunit TctC
MHAVREVAKDAATQKRIADLGGELVAGSPEELSSFIDVEIAKWKKVVTPDMRPN